jgi:hypothetical protein
MKKTELMNKMSRTWNRAGLKLKKHSPEILIVTGVIGVVTSAVMACKATTKLEELMEDSKNQIDKIHECAEKGEVNYHRYTEEDSKKDLTIVYAQTGLKLAKLYGPSVVLGAVSIGCILTSNRILTKRNAALAAAYMAEHTSFKEYRSRLIDRFGKELDKELKYNIKSEEVEETVVNEDGTEQVVKKTVSVMDPNNYSPYAIVFDDGNTGWDPDPGITKFFLVEQQNYANKLLEKQGHLFLNEVYDMLGVRRTKIGNEVGWVYDKEHPIGDNFVDFGLFDINSPKARDFMNGYEKVIILDFNVDGYILDLI